MKNAARLDAAFAALADARRRAVIRALVERPHRAGELAEHVGLSPAALSRHLGVLRRAKLVVQDGVAHDARVRLYRLAPRALTQARTWIDEVERFWTEQLADFKAHAESAFSVRSRRAPRSPP